MLLQTGRIAAALFSAASILTIVAFAMAADSKLSMTQPISGCLFNRRMITWSVQQNMQRCQNYCLQTVSCLSVVYNARRRWCIAYDINRRDLRRYRFYSGRPVLSTPCRGGLYSELTSFRASKQLDEAPTTAGPTTTTRKISTTPRYFTAARDRTQRNRKQWPFSTSRTARPVRNKWFPPTRGFTSRKRLTTTRRVTTTRAPSTTTTTTTQRPTRRTRLRQPLTNFRKNTARPGTIDDVRHICGKRHVRAKRIVNGSPSSAFSFPWQAFYSPDWGRRPGCGASLISPNVAITAAHCIGNPPNLPNMCLFVGATYKSGIRNNHECLLINRVEIHPKFDTSPVKHDIAVLFLEKRLHWNSTVQPICLPQENDLPVGRSCYATGWGMTYAEPHAFPKKPLMQITIDVMPGRNCSTEPDGNLCGYGRSRTGRSAQVCGGDSGGPLSCKRSDGRYELQGVVSWRRGGCVDGVGGFAKVSSVVNWIKGFL